MTVPLAGGRAVLEFYNARSFRTLRKRLLPGRIAPGLGDDQVYVRYDTIREMAGYFSDRFRVETKCGIIVLTPTAQFHAVPIVGHALRLLERIASRSPLGNFGGFLSLVVRKVE